MPSSCEVPRDEALGAEYGARFKATDPKMLDGLKEGDKVRFSADRVNGAISVTRIEAVK